eukprot:scaffold15968_cov46-Cyclotella_meneghiniana.AAC.9
MMLMLRLFSVHPSQGLFIIGFHSEENEMWVYNKDNAALIKVPDESWLEQFQNDNEECDLNNIDDPAPAPTSPVSPAGSNSRQRWKERRAGGRDAAAPPAAAPMQTPATKIQEPVSTFQQWIAWQQLEMTFATTLHSLKIFCFEIQASLSLSLPTRLNTQMPCWKRRHRTI